MSMPTSIVVVQESTSTGGLSTSMSTSLPSTNWLAIASRSTQATPVCCASLYSQTRTTAGAVPSGVEQRNVMLEPTALQQVPLSVSPAADPTLSPDERVLIISTVASGASSTDLYYATRTTRDDDFRVIGPVPGVNVATQSEGDAELSSDGCELYFSATNADGTQTALPRDLYVARVVQ